MRKLGERLCQLAEASEMLVRLPLQLRQRLALCRHPGRPVRLAENRLRPAQVLQAPEPLTREGIALQADLPLANPGAGKLVRAQPRLALAAPAALLGAHPVQVRVDI